ncbi:hypothetical protein N9948_01720 [bacterium]|nr:hypothetical protein [bacterium]
MTISNKELQNKLKNHTFTVIAEPSEGDSSAQEYKAREKQAKQRANNRKNIQAKKSQDKKRGFVLKTNTNHPKYNKTLACKLDKALNS